ncbi:MAG: endolytic transglycosylase MltG [Clostridia bacterium]|nr:endolytic transglycosylase MltG [Clostridia bacterium]
MAARGTKSSRQGCSMAASLLALAALAALLAGGILIAQRWNKHQQTRQASTIATVDITFPEGRTVRQYAALLEEKGVCGAAEFYAAMRDNDYTQDFSFLPDRDILLNREYPLEGYLYPDTYSFYVPESADSVIRRFLKNFEARVSDELVEHANANAENFKRVKMSFDNAVILASIIERESPTDNERAKIAACFYNRMENPSVSGTGGKLQSDATRYYPYVVGSAPEGFVSEYNTYDFAGLPKGPICSPSLSSIKAAVYPDRSCKAYFFYNDINDKHYYAETYEEHLQNIRYCREHGLAA